MLSQEYMVVFYILLNSLYEMYDMHNSILDQIIFNVKLEVLPRDTVHYLL